MDAQLDLRPAGVPPRPAQALGRELLPARRGGDQRRRGQPDRPPGVAGGRARRRAGDRRRRRQHPPRRAADPRLGRDQGGHRPLHGHDGHRHQRPGAAGRPGGPRLRDPADDHDPDGRGRRAVHPPPGPVAPGRGRVVILATGHRQPVRHHRHRRRPAGQGAGRRGPAEGHPRRRRLLGRPREEPARRPLRAPDLRPGPPRRAQGHGHDGHRHVPGEQPADPGLQLQEGRQHRARHRRRADRHLGQQAQPRPRPPA